MSIDTQLVVVEDPGSYAEAGAVPARVGLSCAFDQGASKESNSGLPLS